MRTIEEKIREMEGYESVNMRSEPWQTQERIQAGYGVMH